MRLLRRLRTAWRIMHVSALRLGLTPCPFCAAPFLVKFNDNEHAVRCTRCGAGPVAMSVHAVLQQRLPGLDHCDVYELAARGPLSDYLRRSGARLTASEYLDGVEPGATRDGVLCQDVQRLTFAEGAFDACIATDVFEHVPDDARGFAEIRRVLRDGGLLFLTVPVYDREQTLERAVREGEAIRHLLPPAYHDDPLRGPGTALVFREYGRDIVQRLIASGFATAEIVPAPRNRWWNFGRPVIVARKHGASPMLESAPSSH